MLIGFGSEAAKDCFLGGEDELFQMWIYGKMLAENGGTGAGK